MHLVKHVLEIHLPVMNVMTLNLIFTNIHAIYHVQRILIYQPLIQKYVII